MAQRLLGVGAGQLLLPARQQLLGVLAGRDVVHLGDEEARLALPAAHERDGEQDPDDVSVAVDASSHADDATPSSLVSDLAMPTRPLFEAA